MKIELIYDRECPNVGDTRINLMRTLAATGWPPQWTEWNRSDPIAPDEIHRFGSPTILVDGVEISAREDANGGPCCRMYRYADQRLRGVPPTDLIASALRLRMRRPAGPWMEKLAPLPGVGIALLPKLACPACWPAYTGLLSSVGLGFLVPRSNLFVLTLASLALALGAIALQAFARRRSGALVLGTIAATSTVLGKFVFSSDVVLYTSVVALIGASAWSGWPIRTKAPASCIECSKSVRS